MHWVPCEHCGEAIVLNVSRMMGEGGAGGEAGTGDANAICCGTSDRPYGMAGIVSVIVAISNCFSSHVGTQVSMGCAR